MAKEKIKRKINKNKNNLPFRLNILFLTVFIAFALLILRLGVVQIVRGADYKKIVEGTQSKTAKLDSARGKIYDANGKVLADNQAQLAVVYIRHAGLDGDKSLTLAKKLAKLIHMDTSSVTDRDKQEYYVLTHYKKLQTAYDKYLTKSEQDSLKNKPAKEYDLLLNRIPQNVLNGFTKQEMQVIAIQHEFNQASNLTPHYVKKGLTEKELALIGEHLSEFHGTIETAVASTRKYPDSQYFFLGKVRDIPQEKINSYLAQGYNRNDKVGVSNLEQEYESYLRGVPTTLTFKTKNGEPVGDPTEKEGRRGDDIQLTIDGRLQKQVQSILEKNLRAARGLGGNGTTDSMYAVVINPNTGALLAMGGVAYNPLTGKYEDASEGTVGSAFQMGSAVKGATVLTGFQHHAVPSSVYDMPIHFKGGGSFKSFTSGIGTVTPATALEHSSNVFMGTVAANMAGFILSPSGGFYNARIFTGPKYQKAFEDLRQGYSEFGLGVQTGVDLPFEGTGYQGGIPDQAGKIMQFAIGQFDTYTPLEMAQYISTIANGGYRLAPHLLQSVHAPSGDPNKMGPTIYSVKPKVLNTIKNSKSQLKIVHQGLYLVTHAAAGTGAELGTGANVKYKIAAKTGTAQIDALKDPNLYNKTAVAYAPYDNPQIAVSVVVPSIKSGEPNLDVALDIFKAYDKMYHYTK